MNSEFKNKYYDLVISMIKQHRKFDLCQDFLEEIVEKVFEQSTSVSSLVNNEGVIETYLQKIVSTCVISICKENNLTKRNTTTVPINFETFIPQIEEPAEETFVEPEENEYYNSLGSDESIEIEEEHYVVDENADIEELTADDFEEDTEDDLQTVLEGSSFESSGNDLIDDLETQDEEFEEVVVEKQQEPEVDKSLVDLMINGVSSMDTDNVGAETESGFVVSEEVQEGLDAIVFQNDITETLEDLTDEVVETDDNITELSELEGSEPEADVVNEVSDIMSNEESLFDQDLLVTEIIEEEEPVSIDNEEVATLEVEEPMVIEPVETELEFSADDLSMDNDEIPELNIQTDSIDEVVEIVNDNTQEVLSLAEDVSEDVIADIVETSETITQNPVSSLSLYKPFEFEASLDIDYTANDVNDVIKSVEKQCACNCVRAICEMKFCQKTSVEEISKALQVSEKVVIDVINEVAENVKDW